MQSLRAPERPVSHYRNGRLRGEADGQPASAGGGEGMFDRMAGLMRRQTTPAAAPMPPAPLAAERREPVAPSRPVPRRAAADPSPSRFAYRMERLWLTPGFRLFMRYGVPVLVVAALVGGYLASDGRRAALTGQFVALRDRIENRPEFMVKLLSIDGASPPVADAIRAMVPADLPVSSFKLDLDGFRDAIAAMDAVADVSVKLKAGGVLGVTVTERKPAVLWRTEAGLEMLDATGHRVATLLERAARPDLPVVTGAGAEDAVPEALAVLSAARPILAHVRGLVRVGDRRWDMVMDRGQRIMLPEDRPVDAIEEVIALDKAEDMLARDLTAIDLRNSQRPTLRLSADAAAVLHGATQTETKVESQ